MKTIAIAMVKNEQDIIEPFVRHNLKYIDRIYVLDHFSNDQTATLLQKMRSEGLAVVPMQAKGHLHAGAYLQSEIMTQLFSLVHEREKHGCYIFLDADEFLDHRDGRLGLEREFESVGHAEVVYVPWRTHVVPADATPGYFADPPRSFTSRRAHENPEIFKAMLKIVENHRLPNIEIAQGNHNIVARSNSVSSVVNRALGFKSYRVLRGSKSLELVIRHYPVRSGEQVFQKAVLGWLSILQKYPSAREKNINSQWRVIFDELLNNQPIDTCRLHEISVSYAQDFNDCDVIYDNSAHYNYTRRYGMNRNFQITLILKELERRAIAQGHVTNSFLNRITKRIVRFWAGHKARAVQFSD